MVNAHRQPDGRYLDDEGKLLKKEVQKYLTVNDRWQDEKGKWHKVESKEILPNGGIVVVSKSED